MEKRWRYDVSRERRRATLWGVVVSPMHLAIRESPRSFSSSKASTIHPLSAVQLYNSFQMPSHLVQMPSRLNVVHPSSQCVVHASDQQHSAEHGARPVHVCDRGRVHGREEARDASHRDVEECEGIDGDCTLTEREARWRKRFFA